MALIDVVVLSAPDRSTSPPEVVAPGTPDGIAAFLATPDVGQMPTTGADMVVVIDEGAELIPDWYLHVLVAVEAEPNRLHTPPPVSYTHLTLPTNREV